MELAAEGCGHLLELPETGLLLNHVGTIHASVQFALAEACSGEFLLRHFGANEVFAVLRRSEVKFRRPAQGNLLASARSADAATEALSRKGMAPGRALVSVFVEVSDAQGVITMSGRYDWFLQRQAVIR